MSKAYARWPIIVFASFVSLAQASADSNSFVCRGFAEESNSGMAARLIGGWGRIQAGMLAGFFRRRSPSDRTEALVAALRFQASDPLIFEGFVQALGRDVLGNRRSPAFSTQIMRADRLRALRALVDAPSVQPESLAATFAADGRRILVSSLVRLKAIQDYEGEGDLLARAVESDLMSFVYNGVGWIGYFKNADADEPVIASFVAANSRFKGSIPVFALGDGPSAEDVEIARNFLYQYVGRQAPDFAQAAPAAAVIARRRALIADPGLDLGWLLTASFSRAFSEAELGGASATFAARTAAVTMAAIVGRATTPIAGPRLESFFSTVDMWLAGPHANVLLGAVGKILDANDGFSGRARKAAADSNDPPKNGLIIEHLLARAAIAPR